MVFHPIKLRDYVRLHLKSNPGDKAAVIVAQLESALAAYEAGERCQCGEPIWVIGSSQVGHMCFTCITGEADCSDDYEIDEACDKLSAPGSRNKDAAFK
jgi:hypothetical protein